MPSLLTHTLLGEVTLYKCDINQLLSIINKNKKSYFVGCQGPDIYLYYHNLPWQSKKSYPKIRKLASDMHRVNVNEHFKVLLTKAKELKNESLIAYVAGFLAHHSLDSIAHPYVYYFTDSLDKDVSFCHQIFENQIDYAILKEYKLTVAEYNVTKRVAKIKDREDIVSTLIEGAKIFDCQLSEDEVNDCLGDTAFIASFLRDTNGKKYKLIEKLEKLFHMEKVGTSMVVPLSYDDKLDVMNYRREQWLNPCDDSIKSNSSFTDLFQLAINKLANELVLFEKYLFSNETIDALLAEIADKSYESGRSDGKEMKFFKKDLI